MNDVSLFPQENKSLLNEKIAKFYKESEGTDNHTEDISKYFVKNGGFQAREIIEKLFPGQADTNSIFVLLDSFQYEDYVKLFAKLFPILTHTTTIIHILGNNYLSLMKLQWLGVNVKTCLKLIQENNGNPKCTTIVEHILLLTSMLENALASIYYTKTKGKQAPHLLKDLISTKEIRETFDPELVIILKILMGSPNSINLRNIVWHGFPKPLEILQYYKTVMLILIHSLGCKIEERNFTIIERPLVMDFKKFLQVIENSYKKEFSNISFYEQRIKNIRNDFASDYMAYWLQLSCYYQERKYVPFIILALPQIELLLRLHYGHINGVDISAKLDEYYITMDTIFEMELQHKSSSTENEQVLNKLLDFSRYSNYRGCFHLMYDIFLCPNGCRLRDKVSHGEIGLEALDNPLLASLILHIFLNLLQPLSCNTLNEYESKLHLNCINKQLLAEVHHKLAEFQQNILENHTTDLSQTSTEISKILIFQRPRKEAELMLLIRMIAENINQTLTNYEESIARRTTLMAQRELHSKRRKTLENVQNSLPEIFIILKLMYTSLSTLYSILQENFVAILEDEKKCLKTVRYLKHARTISENFVKYSHCDSNEWIKSLELCRKFQDFYNKLFLYRKD